MKLATNFKAFSRWLNQLELRAAPPMTKAPTGAKKTKRAPRLKDELVTAQQRTQAKAEMDVWKKAEDRALNPMRPRRDTLMALYQNITKDNYLTGQMTTLKNKVLSESYVLLDKNGKEQPDLLAKFERPWFIDFLSRVLDTDFYGHTLINFDYPETEGEFAGEFTRFDLIPRGQVVPEFGMVLLKPTDDAGIPFRDVEADYVKLLLEVRMKDDEGKDHLGILTKAAPEIIWKRYSRADWSRYSEKFGMPLVNLKTSVVEETELANREAGLANLGANGYIITDKEEELELLETTKTDGSAIYKSLTDACNDEIAYLIAGQTMTSQDGSSKSQGEVHERVQEHYIQARMRFLSLYINYSLFPFLKQWNYPLEGIQFKWTKWLAEAKPAPDAGPKPPAQDPEKDTPPAPNAQDKKPKKTKLSTPNFTKATLSRVAAPAEVVELADGESRLLRLFNDLLKKLHTDNPKIKKVLKSAEWVALYRETARQLTDAVQAGYGLQLPDLEFGRPDAVLLTKLTEHLYVFSANKSYQLLTELNKLLVVNGEVRDYDSFQKEALLLHQDYNENWLRTEYDTAVATGQMAAKWLTFQENQDKYYLRYSTVGDDRVRPAHHELDGIILPVDHEFWNTHYPPLGWKCRCTVVRVSRAGKKVTDPDTLENLTQKPPEFGHNAGKDGVVFPDSHTYNDVPEGVQPLLRRMAKEDAPQPKPKKKDD